MPISRGTVFTGAAFSECLDRWGIRHRLGAVGSKGSVAVAERTIKTLKDEWLNRVALVRGFEHLTDLCGVFLEWYNDWRPHSSLDGATPNDVFQHLDWRRPEHHAKTVAKDIEVKRRAAARVAAFRLKAAA